MQYYNYVVTKKSKFSPVASIMAS